MRDHEDLDPDHEPEPVTPKRPKRERVRRLSFWKIFGLDWQVQLLDYLIDVKGRMLAKKRIELALDAEMLELGCSERLWPSSMGDPMLCLAAGSESVTVEPVISDEAINSVALRAVTQATNLSPEKAQQFWAEFRIRIQQRYPAYAAAEIERRVLQLRGQL